MDERKPWGTQPGDARARWDTQETTRLRAMVHDGKTDARGVAIKRQRLGLTARQLARPGSVAEATDEMLARELRRRGYRVFMGREKLHDSTTLQRLGDRVRTVGA